MTLMLACIHMWLHTNKSSLDILIIYYTQCIKVIETLDRSPVSMDTNGGGIKFICIYDAIQYYSRSTFLWFIFCSSCFLD